MTAIVSDTSPLNYLILIRAQDLLCRLFSTVLVPAVVAEELSHPKAPQQVRAWIANPPAWLGVRSPKRTVYAFKLDRGEAHAILLAEELGVLSLLIDERKGFSVAESLGLEPIGLLGVLEHCAARGWIDFDEHLARLRATSFRVQESLIQRIKSRLAAR
jgi:predicted nucleic acid-binding protein